MTVPVCGSVLTPSAGLPRAGTSATVYPRRFIRAKVSAGSEVRKSRPKVRKSKSPEASPKKLAKASSMSSLQASAPVLATASPTRMVYAFHVTEASILRVEQLIWSIPHNATEYRKTATSALKFEVQQDNLAVTHRVYVLPTLSHRKTIAYDTGSVRTSSFSWRRGGTVPG